MFMVQSVGTMALGRFSKCFRSLHREPFKAVFCGLSQPGWIEGCIGAKRHLLTEDFIQLQNYQRMKLDTCRRNPELIQGRYVENFKQKLQRNEPVQGNELKRLLHLCQSADDTMIARDAIYRYKAENQNFKSGFRFGPVFVRLCYEQGLEDLAAATLTDQFMKGFFDLTSFNIAIYMLFMKGSYESALEVLRTMRNQGVFLNKDTMILASGTCYKLNTTESFRICNSLIEETEAKGLVLSEHTYCFALALALRQNDIKKAQSLCLQIMGKNTRLGQHLEVLTLAMSGKVMAALSILSSATLPNVSSFVKPPAFSQEVLDVLRLQSEGGPYMMQVKQVVTQLEQANQVTQQTLDDMLCHTPTRKGLPIIYAEMTSQQTPSRSILRSE